MRKGRERRPDRVGALQGHKADPSLRLPGAGRLGMTARSGGQRDARGRASV